MFPNTRRVKTLHATSLLQPRSIASRDWLDISMDFIEGLPLLGEQAWLWLWLTDWANTLISCPSHIHTLLQQWLEFSWTTSSNFIGCLSPLSVIESLFSKLVLERVIQDLWHRILTQFSVPSSNKWTNRDHEQRIRILPKVFLQRSTKRLGACLSLAEYVYSISIHTSTRLSPFEVV